MWVTQAAELYKHKPCVTPLAAKLQRQLPQQHAALCRITLVNKTHAVLAFWICSTSVFCSWQSLMCMLVLYRADFQARAAQWRHEPLLIGSSGRSGAAPVF